MKDQNEITEIINAKSQSLISHSFLEFVTLIADKMSLEFSGKKFVKSKGLQNPEVTKLKVVFYGKKIGKSKRHNFSKFTPVEKITKSKCFLFVSRQKNLLNRSGANISLKILKYAKKTRLDTSAVGSSSS